MPLEKTLTATGELGLQALIDHSGPAHWEMARPRGAPPMSIKIHHLSRLLTEMFSVLEFVRWTTEIAGDEVCASALAAQAPFLDLTFKTCEALRNRGMIDTRLFDALIRVRPERALDIRRALIATLSPVEEFFLGTFRINAPGYTLGFAPKRSKLVKRDYQVGEAIQGFIRVNTVCHVGLLHDSAPDRTLSRVLPDDAAPGVTLVLPPHRFHTIIDGVATDPPGEKAFLVVFAAQAADLDHLTRFSHDHRPRENLASGLAHLDTLQRESMIRVERYPYTVIG